MYFKVYGEFVRGEKSFSRFFIIYRVIENIFGFYVYYEELIGFIVV